LDLSLNGLNQAKEQLGTSIRDAELRGLKIDIAQQSLDTAQRSLDADRRIWETRRAIDGGNNQLARQQQVYAEVLADQNRYKRGVQTVVTDITKFNSEKYGLMVANGVGAGGKVFRTDMGLVIHATDLVAAANRIERERGQQPQTGPQTPYAGRTDAQRASPPGPSLDDPAVIRLAGAMVTEEFYRRNPDSKNVLQAQGVIAQIAVGIVTKGEIRPVFEFSPFADQVSSRVSPGVPYDVKGGNPTVVFDESEYARRRSLPSAPLLDVERGRVKPSAQTPSSLGDLTK
jgi:hypothetical protein